MGRKGIEINPKSADKIKIVCKEQGITQKALALAIAYTPEYINGIANGKKGLSFEAAQRICNAFPDAEYRPEWLLGQDDVKTVTELRLQAKAAMFKRLDDRKLAVQILARLVGYDIEFDQYGGAKIAEIEAQGKKTIEVSNEQISQMLDEITDLVRLPIKWVYDRERFVTDFIQGFHFDKQKSNDQPSD